MTVMNPEITHADVIPTVESNLFVTHPGARLAMGIVAVGNQVMPGLENEFKGYLDLRRAVYVDQTGQLDTSELNEQGVDWDANDARSVHFGIIENHRKDDGSLDQRVVGATRLIIKGFGPDADAERPLPIEEFCPDLFDEHPTPTWSDEVSRLIVRHELPGMQKILRWDTYATALSYIRQHHLSPTYGVIEPWLEQHFGQSGVPVQRIGEPRYIDHYGDYNLPIEVDTDEFAQVIERRQPGLLGELALNQFIGEMTYVGKVAPIRPLLQPVPPVEYQITGLSAAA